MLWWKFLKKRCVLLKGDDFSTWLCDDKILFSMWNLLEFILSTFNRIQPRRQDLFLIVFCKASQVIPEFFMIIEAAFKGFSWLNQSCSQKIAFPAWKKLTRTKVVKWLFINHNVEECYNYLRRHQSTDKTIRFNW